MKSVLMLLVSVLFVSQAYSASGTTLPTTSDPAVRATYKEIEQTFGMIPTFLKEFPQEGIVGAWQEMRDVQLSPDTKLDGKTKELIGLAVASQIPCSYCVYFHKRAAKFNGANDKDLKVAIAVSAEARKWSAHFYGEQTPMDTFKSDVNKMISYIKEQQSKKMTPPAHGEAVATADEAYKEMERMNGLVPEFAKSYSARGIVGAWNELKGISMNSKSPLPPKTLDLASLAVSAQIPCQYCTYIDTEFAKLDGASPEEIKEAVAIAGNTRHWSTFLNGLQQPQKEFEREVDQIFKNLERKRGATNKRISSN